MMRLSYYKSNSDQDREVPKTTVIAGDSYWITDSKKSVQLSYDKVLAILNEVVLYSSAKIKIEFEDITLEFE